MAEDDVELPAGRCPGRSKKWDEVEAEFDEPAFDVVAGFAAMGYSRLDVARLLGWSPENAYRLVRQVDPEGRIVWPARNRSRRRLEGRRRSPAAAVQRYYRGRGRHRCRRVTIDGVERTLAEWVDELGARHGVDQKLAYQRIFWGGWAPRLALTTPPGEGRA